MAEACALVWLKRDLRSMDHAPLVAAAAFTSVAAIYVVEPEWLSSPECDVQHVAFAEAQVASLRETLRARGMPLLIRYGSIIQVFSALRRELPFHVLLSHEETGPGWSYKRDRALASWCKQVGITWQEWPQNGVVRRLKERNGWASQWQRRMDAPVLQVPSRWSGAPGLELGHWPSAEVQRMTSGHARPLPAAGNGLLTARCTVFWNGAVRATWKRCPVRSRRPRGAPD